MNTPHRTSAAAFSRYAAGEVVADSASLQWKELFVVPDAGHVDLYDRVELIPFDKLTAFFTKNLE